MLDSSNMLISKLNVYRQEVEQEFEQTREKILVEKKITEDLVTQKYNILVEEISSEVRKRTRGISGIFII